MSNRTTKFEKLLKVLASRPMNYTEIRNWLASRSAGFRAFEDTKLYDLALYGTANRVGLLERFCRKNSDGRWQTVRKVEAPFTPVRYGLTDDQVTGQEISDTNSGTGTGYWY
jgi:hypothetical protein